jgi:hypothetical protein
MPTLGPDETPLELQQLCEWYDTGVEQVPKPPIWLIPTSMNCPCKKQSVPTSWADAAPATRKLNKKLSEKLRILQKLILC